MLVDPDHRDPVEPGRVGDQHPPPLGQHRVVGGVPRHRQRFGDPGDRQVLTHQRLQRPPQRRPRQPGPRLGRRDGVLPPHLTAATATVTAHHHQQDRRPPPHRFVRQPARHRVPRHALPPQRRHTGRPPTTRHANTARSGSRNWPVTRNPSPSKRANVVTSGSAKVASSHVEVLRMSGVRTFILRGPRPSPRHRRADHSRQPRPGGPTPLNWDEPLIVIASNTDFPDQRRRCDGFDVVPDCRQAAPDWWTASGTSATTPMNIPAAGVHSRPKQYFSGSPNARRGAGARGADSLAA